MLVVQGPGNGGIASKRGVTPGYHGDGGPSAGGATAVKGRRTADAGECHLLHFMYAIAKSAIGPASQAVTNNGEV